MQSAEALMIVVLAREKRVDEVVRTAHQMGPFEERRDQNVLAIVFRGFCVEVEERCY